MLCDLHKSDPSFHTELTQQCTRRLQAPVFSKQEVQQENADYGNATTPDDSDVPLPEVIAHCDDLTKDTGQEDTTHIYVANSKDGGLSSAAEAEDTHIESVHNILLDVSGAFAGCAKRVRHGNMLYSFFFFFFFFFWWSVR